MSCFFLFFFFFFFFTLWRQSLQAQLHHSSWDEESSGLSTAGTRSTEERMRQRWSYTSKGKECEESSFFCKCRAERWKPRFGQNATTGWTWSRARWICPTLPACRIPESSLHSMEPGAPRSQTRGFAEREAPRLREVGIIQHSSPFSGIPTHPPNTRWLVSCFPP